VTTVGQPGPFQRQNLVSTDDCRRITLAAG
jgi:hypothetical protein